MSTSTNTIANEFMNSYRHLFLADLSIRQAFVSDDNSVIHDCLDGFGYVQKQEVLFQETWIFKDGSYLTRNGEEYWTGHDIDDFLGIAASLNN